MPPCNHTTEKTRRRCATQPLVLIKKQKTRIKEAVNQGEGDKQVDAEANREAKKKKQIMVQAVLRDKEEDKRDESKCALPQTSVHSSMRKLLNGDFKKV